MIGGVEILAIGGTLVLLLGAKKLPALAHSVGRSKGELERGLRESRAATNAEQEVTND